MSTTSETRHYDDPLLYVLPNHENLSDELWQEARVIFTDCGSALDTSLPPWDRYESTLVRWPGRTGYHNGIPVVADRAQLPSHNSSAATHNAFLALVAAEYNTTRRPEGMSTTAWHERGPSIFPTRVYAASSRGRQDLATYGDRVVVRGPGRSAVDRVVSASDTVGIPISLWSAIVPVAAQQASMANGTLYVMGSVGPKADLVRRVHMRRWYREHPEVEPTDALEQTMNANIDADMRDSRVGHISGLFIQSRNDWPVEHSDGSYTFDGVYQRVYIYDPSHPHDGAAVGSEEGPFLQATAAGRVPRLRDILFISNTTALVYGPDGFKRRARWVEQPGKVFIGGGGNFYPVAACVEMTCNWIQQTAFLSTQLTRARQGLSDAPNNRAVQAKWKLALSNWDCWFLAYQEVRK